MRQRNAPLKAFASPAKEGTEKKYETRPLTEDEKKPKMNAAEFGAPAAIYKGGKALIKAHTKLHKESEGVREATKQTKPWAMGSMK